MKNADHLCTLALEDIENSTEAEVINLSLLNIFTIDDYFDLTHLNRQGQEKLSQYFSNYLSKMNIPVQMNN